MERLTQNGTPVSDGADVAVGCSAKLALYDWLLRQDQTTLGPRRAMGLPEKTAAMRRAFDPNEITDRAGEETRAKHLDQAALDQRMDRLRAAGAPALAQDIGVGTHNLRRTLAYTLWLRRRFSVLGLLQECGLPKAAIDATFPPYGT
jgi:hypothetical protein